MLKKLSIWADKILDRQIEEICRWSRSPESDRFKITPEGGYAIRLINKTGAPSIKGMVLDGGSVDMSVSSTEADDYDPMGIMYSNGVADGDYVWVVVAGIAEVLLQDGTAATRNYWVRTSTTTGGRADATNAAPPGLVLQHFAEIGHALESKGAGTSVLCKIALHFN